MCGKVGFPARRLLRPDPGFSGDSGLRDTTKDGFGLKRRLPLCGGLQGQRVGDPLDCWGSDDATERPDARQSRRICYFPSWGFICA